MEHAPQTRQLLHRLEAVSVGLPVMDHHRQILLHSQAQLDAQQLQLGLPGGRVLIIIIQADLPHGHHLLLPQHGLHGGQVVGSVVPGGLRVDARGGIDMGEPPGQGQAHQRSGGIGAAVDDAANAAVRQGGQQRIPVGLEALVVIMGVGIEKHGDHLHYNI